MLVLQQVGEGELIEVVYKRMPGLSKASVNEHALAASTVALAGLTVYVLFRHRCGCRERCRKSHGN